MCIVHLYDSEGEKLVSFSFPLPTYSTCLSKLFGQPENFSAADLGAAAEAGSVSGLPVEASSAATPDPAEEVRRDASRRIGGTEMAADFETILRRASATRVVIVTTGIAGSPEMAAPGSESFKNLVLARTDENFFGKKPLV